MFNNCSTSCCGVEPIEKSYGVGYKKHDGTSAFSPYERVNRLVDKSHDMRVSTNSQRPLLFTKAFKKYEACPIVIKKARAVENCLLNFEMFYNKNELFLGDIGGNNYTAVVYTEYAFDWVINELRNFPLYERTIEPIHYDEKTRDDILGVESYWRGKTVKECGVALLSEDALKGSHIGGKNIYSITCCAEGGVGHTTPDYEKLLKLGLGGIKQHVRECMAKDDITTAEGIKANQFHQAQLIVLEAASQRTRMYAKFAGEQAEKPEYAEYRNDLLRMKANCEHVAENPPRDMWEALQLINMAYMVFLIESSGHAISLGRMDQYLLPIYKADMEKGTFTKDFIQELIEVFSIKNEVLCKKIHSRSLMEMNRAGFAGWIGTSLVLGGIDKDGNDATNDLTFMFLDCIAHTRIPNPWPTVRMHKGTPNELKIKVAEVLRIGTGHPKLFNDETAMKAVIRKGIPESEAWNYINIGCVEPDIPGYEYGWHDSAYFNMAKVFELALNNGRCLLCNEKCHRYSRCAGAGNVLGLDTGSIKDYKSIDEVKDAFSKQLAYWIDRMVTTVEAFDIAHQQHDALPWLSCFINDCTEKGVDVTCGGARYNFTGPEGMGLGTVADSLSVLKQLVFEEKKFTGEQFSDALKKNWKGYEALYALVNSDKVHHYGNDDDYADEFAQFVFNEFCSMLENRKNSRGGKYTAGIYTAAANVPFGFTVGATPDGRKAMEPVSDNLGPVHTSAGSHDRLGPTALAKSIAKIDHSRATNGTLINMKFSPETVSGDAGRQNFIDFIDTYFEAKPMHIQIMITDKETLIDAQNHPENYQDLLVRVSGYSAYFTNLGRNLQNDLIGRTEQSFE